MLPEKSGKVKRITIALILFQLIGCAKQPVVTTHPEKKQEQETLQHDTPQAPKTNYLKIGGAIVGILTILASIGLIAYCCRQKEEERHDESLSDTDDEILIDPQEQAKKIAEKIAKQDKKDIDRITMKSVNYIQLHYPAIKDFIIQVYTNHPKYKGKPELKAILRWYFLEPVPEGTIGARPGETNLSDEREYVKDEVATEIEQARKANPTLPMPEVFTNIESSSKCFIATSKQFMMNYNENLEVEAYIKSIERDGDMRAADIMSRVADIIYYYAFKEAIIRNDKKQGERR